jgi:hypothetical protein
VVDDLPLTAMQKVDRRRLAALVAAATATTGTDATGTTGTGATPGI